MDHLPQKLLTKTHSVQMPFQQDMW